MDSCDECGFIYARVSGFDLAAMYRSLVPRLKTLLLAPAAANLVQVRPATGVWSALEYTCHLRDVFLVNRERVYLAMLDDTPTFPSMHPQERVDFARYNRQDPARVAYEFDIATGLLAEAFSGRTSEQLQRLCVYNYPEPTMRTVQWVGRHTLHEGEHHLLDIKSVLGRLSAPA